LDYVICPPEVKKPINTRVEALKKTINDIYNSLKTGSKVQKRKSALKGFVTSYRIKGIDKMDPKTFLENNKQDVLDLLKQQEKPIKMKFLLECEFYKMNKKEKIFTLK